MAQINWGVSCDASSPELLWAFFPLRWCNRCFCTHLSSGSSFSSLVGVTLIPPFLARGQPDKLKEAHRIKAPSFCCCLPRTLSAAAPCDGTVFTFGGMHSSPSRGQSRHSQVSGTYRIIQGAYKIQLQRYTANVVHLLRFVWGGRKNSRALSKHLKLVLAEFFLKISRLLSLFFFFCNRVLVRNVKYIAYDV